VITAPSRGFVLLSMPKCGSTSLETALAPYHEQMRGRVVKKHANARTFVNIVQRQLRRGGYAREDYEVVSMYRDPVAWLESWWRYRKRPFVRRQRRDRFTGKLSFEEFAALYLDEDREATGISGRPTAFLAKDDSGEIAVDRIFLMDRPDVWGAWFSERVGEPLDITVLNRSTTAPAPELPPTLQARLQEYLAPEYDVLERLRESGQWQPPPGYIPGVSRDL
jgi:hypothetical protein